MNNCLGCKRLLKDLEEARRAAASYVERIEALEKLVGEAETKTVLGKMRGN